MAKHYMRAAKPKKPRAELRAAPSFYEKTHPVGSAERFLDEAAKEAMLAAVAGGVITPRRAALGAAKAVAKEAGKYPDPLLAEAAKLPKDELMKRAARAEAYQKAMDVQNKVAATVAAVNSPVGNMVTTLAAADAAEALQPTVAKAVRRVAGAAPREEANPEPAAREAAETFDTPIPKELQAKYDAWYAQLPENLQHTEDYDLQGTWLERLGQPDKYEASQNGHLDDYGKKPNHITFSTGSKWHDPEVPERTGGEWKQADDGSWDFYPGTGNKASDDELKAYFEKYEKGNRVHGREVRQDAEGGDAGSETAVSETPVSEAPQNPGGPRIVINPTTFTNKKDALCVAFNEGFRLWMEANDFQPQSEPTDRQRKFFSDTAYADDELQLRRTILARIATFDTSVKDPTDDQLAETASFLNAILESDWCKNEWERNSVEKLARAVEASVGAEPVEPRAEPVEPRAETPLEARAALGGGETKMTKSELEFLMRRAESGATMTQSQRDLVARANAGGVSHKSKAFVTIGAPEAEEAAPAAAAPADNGGGGVAPAADAAPGADAAPAAAAPANNDGGGVAPAASSEAATSAPKSPGTPRSMTAPSMTPPPPVDGQSENALINEVAKYSDAKILPSFSLGPVSATEPASKKEPANTASVDIPSLAGMAMEAGSGWLKGNMERNSAPAPAPVGAGGTSPSSLSLSGIKDSSNYLIDRMIGKAKSAALTATVESAANALWTIGANTSVLKDYGWKGAKALAKSIGEDTLSAFDKAAASVLKPKPGLGIKTPSALGFAVAGVKSGIEQHKKFMEDKEALGATWGDVGSAFVDTITSKKGWRNIGRGALGALMDVGNKLSFGMIPDGDNVRESMEYGTYSGARGYDPGEDIARSTAVQIPLMVGNALTRRKKR